MIAREEREEIVGIRKAVTMVIKSKKKSGIIQKTLRLVTCSDLRRGFLVSLREEKKALSELRDEMGVSSTTAIHALRELEKDNLVFQDTDRNYVLTRTGKIIALKLADFIDTIDVLKKHEDFWLTHDLSGIPPHLLEKIGWLRNSVVVKDTATDIFKVHSNYIDMLKDTKEVKGVSSIFVPEYPLVFEELIRGKKANVELIVTEEVLGKIDEEILKEIFTDKSSKFKLYITKEDIKAAFTVTDFFIAFGFYRLDGTYDYSNDLRSYDKEAIEWGKELFEWHRKQAERVLI